jgi:hypothetical protein
MDRHVMGTAFAATIHSELERHVGVRWWARDLLDDADRAELSVVGGGDHHAGLVAGCDDDGVRGD